MTVLHVTNGDSAVGALRSTGFDGRFLPWRDVLHDGPVPGGLDASDLAAARAAFIHESGWLDQEQALLSFHDRDRRLADPTVKRIVLWFEHDLYDQLQLIQILSRLAESADRTVELICEDRFVAEQDPIELHAMYDRRVPVSAAHTGAAIAAWQAFRAPDPVTLCELSTRDVSSLPHLAPALRRQLEEYPDSRSGLARSERQILATVDRGEGEGIEMTVADVFRTTQAMEAARFMGDASFWARLAAMGDPGNPLLRLSTGVPGPVADRDAFRAEVHLTPAGRAVLRGDADRVDLLGLDRWIGGVHLRSEDHWRWDPEKERMEERVR